jgi:hypothetical protein
MRRVLKLKKSNNTHGDEMNGLLNSDKVQALEVSVEEATRSTDEGVKRFIEPAHGTLQRTVAKRPHIVFGRRGSGKSSLLRKVVFVYRPHWTNPAQSCSVGLSETNRSRQDAKPSGVEQATRAFAERE